MRSGRITHLMRQRCTALPRCSLKDTCSKEWVKHYTAKRSRRDGAATWFRSIPHGRVTLRAVRDTRRCKVTRWSAARPAMRTGRAAWKMCIRDSLSIVSDTREGPFVVESGVSSIVSTNGKTVYRNGYASTADAIRRYDVVYYNDSTIWAYANAVTGTYQSASPSTSSPTSVTVAGAEYEIETSDAALALSTLGGLNIGDIITLLLGRDGKVVAAMSADEYAADVAGVVTATGTGTYYNSVGNAYTCLLYTSISSTEETATLCIPIPKVKQDVYKRQVIMEVISSISSTISCISEMV